MPKIAINLLPAEFTAGRLKDARFYKIQAVGVGMVLFVVFLSSLTVALGVLQSQRIEQAKTRLDSATQKVATFKDRQAMLMALKNRLTEINRYLGVPSKQTELFNLLNLLLPGVEMNTLIIDGSGNITFSAVVPDSATLDSVMQNLYDRDKNRDKISQIALESLNLGRDNVYRVNIKIKPKNE